jgi:hypothetical protein
MSGFKVNFLIAGAQKGGTTALSSFLSSDPRICLAPSKEVHFFDAADYDDKAGPEDIARRYQEAFPNYRGQALVGEATPIYMYLPQVAERIRRYNPEMKLILLLRDPVERALSHYRMNFARGFERRSLAVALALEPLRLLLHRADLGEDSPLRFHSYLDRGFYSRQIRNLQRSFPAAQILIVRSEDLWHHHEAVLRRIYAFLGIEPAGAFPPRDRVYASTAEVKPHPWLRRLLRLRYAAETRALQRLLQETGSARPGAGHAVMPEM